MKRVSIIISTYSKDKLSDLSDCINSLKRQLLKPDEIILVLDPNPDLAKFYESKFHNDVKIVISDHYGLSNARNAGVKSAEGEIVVFIDSDAIPGKSWLENLVKNYEDPNVVGVGGLVKPFWEAGSPSWFPEE